MFGYILTNKEELKIKEWNRYQSFYCGLCRTLRTRHGIKGQMTLNYDMVFLAILLSALYESQTETKSYLCPLHPTKKQRVFQNEILEYVADMDILLAYHNLRDGWQDEKNVAKLLSAQILKSDYQKTALMYPRQSKAVTEYMEDLNKCQNRLESNVDVVAGLTGTMMAELFVFREDEWSDRLRWVGFFLGKFIYLMDAFDDMEQDQKKKQFNVWLNLKQSEELNAMIQETLIQTMAECAKIFEELPIILDIELLRNIIYAGVWTKYHRKVQSEHDRSL